MVSMRTCVLGRGCLMYPRKGVDQQASYRLCNLNPLHPILCELFIFIHIIDCGYSLESFNDAHEKKQLNKTKKKKKKKKKRKEKKIKKIT